MVPDAVKKRAGRAAKGKGYKGDQKSKKGKKGTGKGMKNLEEHERPEGAPNEEPEREEQYCLECINMTEEDEIDYNIYDEMRQDAEGILQPLPQKSQQKRFRSLAWTAEFSFSR